MEPFPDYNAIWEQTVSNVDTPLSIAGRFMDGHQTGLPVGEMVKQQILYHSCPLPGLSSSFDPGSLDAERFYCIETAPSWSGIASHLTNIGHQRLRPMHCASMGNKHACLIHTVLDSTCLFWLDHWSYLTTLAFTDSKKDNKLAAPDSVEELLHCKLPYQAGFKSMAVPLLTSDKQQADLIRYIVQTPQDHFPPDPQYQIDKHLLFRNDGSIYQMAKHL